MQLRRFTGDSTSSVLAELRATLGDDAMILSNRQVNGRVEIIATGTIDDALLASASNASPAFDGASAPADATARASADDVSVSLSESARAAAEAVAPPPEPAPESPGRRPSDAEATEGAPLDTPSAAASGDVRSRDARSDRDESSEAGAAREPSAHDETRSVIDSLSADLAAMSEDERPLILGAVPPQPGRNARRQGDKTHVAETRPDEAAPAPPAASTELASSADDREPTSSTVGAIGQVLAVAERRHADRARRLEHRLGRLEVNLWGEFEPLKAAHLRQLVRLGIGAELAVKLVERVTPDMGSREAVRQSLALLKSTLPIAVDDTGTTPGVTVMSGPTGGGKTTALVKLAARQVREAGSQSLVLISADTRRIGAFESLQVYARLLGVPALQARSEEELADLLVSLAHKPLVLVDHVPVDRDDAMTLPSSSSLGAFEGKARVLRHLLVLPATLETRSFETEVAMHRAHGIDYAVLTQLDRAARIAACFAPLVRHQLPVAWLSDDARVQKPLERAGGATLVAAAATIGRQTAASADESFLLNLMQPTRHSCGETAAKETSAVARGRAGRDEVEHVSPSWRSVHPAGTEYAARDDERSDAYDAEGVDDAEEVEDVDMEEVEARGAESVREAPTVAAEAPETDRARSVYREIDAIDPYGAGVLEGPPRPPQSPPHATDRPGCTALAVSVLRSNDPDITQTMEMTR